MKGVFGPRGIDLLFVDVSREVMEILFFSIELERALISFVALEVIANEPFIDLIAKNFQAWCFSFGRFMYLHVDRSGMLVFAVGKWIGLEAVGVSQYSFSPCWFSNKDACA